MQVRVLFFGILKDLVGHSSDTLTLPDNATLQDVLAHYESRIDNFCDLGPSLAISINQEYAVAESKLCAGDEIALLPPVSGGSNDLASGSPVNSAAIVRDKIETSVLLEKMKRPADGALAVFEGIVRDHSRGRRTLFLEYEAYADMAVKQMNGLIKKALSQFAIREAVIVHRIGRLEIGETSVVVAVASAHRGAAFDACRWLIDNLKQTVPIWKKEYFEDGAVWAPGEPFPPEIERAQNQIPANPASN